MIAIASWASESTVVHLRIDWKRLGLDPRTAALRAEPIDRFQPARRFPTAEGIPVEPGRGWLLVIEEAGK